MIVDTALLPIVVGGIEKLAHKHIWVDNDSWERGYNAIAEMLAMQNGIVEAINRLYRLTDAIYNGTAYTADESTPPVVTPEIPVSPAATPGIAVGLRRQLLDSQGVLPAGWFGWGSAPATMADLVRAVRADTESQVERVKDSFNALQTLAQGATVFDVVSNFITEGAEITAEGGILATLIVSTMAQAAMMGAQAGQLDQLIAKMDRLITSMDGGATPAPTANVVSELADIRTLLG
jgi:hypothetical protein